MTRRAASSYIRRKVVEHYARPHPIGTLSCRGRRVMFCGGGHEGRGCDHMIDVGLSDWEAEHHLAAFFDGADEPPNTYPICIPCHKAKTYREDRPAIDKAKRVMAQNAGIKRASKPMPHGRRSATKRKLNGEVVPR